MNWLTHVVDKADRRLRMRSLRRQLGAFSDAQLADFGLARYQLDGVARSLTDD
jgi:uncharacterized protein YjiS (DUF1127 family)